MVGQQEKGRNFNLNSSSSYSFSRVSTHTPAAVSKKSHVTECSNFKTACKFSLSHLCSYKTNIFSLCSFFLFLCKSNCCWTLCWRIEERVWELDGERSAAAQPSGPLSPLPSACHQGEWTRLTKWQAQARLCPFTQWWIYTNSVPLIRFTRVKIKYSVLSF